MPATSQAPPSFRQSRYWTASSRSHRTRASPSSSTARPVPDRCARHCRWPHSATPTWPPWPAVSGSGSRRAGRSSCPTPRPPIARNPRYARHLVMPEVGPEGQGKLNESKVLFIGAGGLGSPGLLYLAAAGVGTLGIVDFDVVDLSNLQRQVVHTDDRIGMKKTQSAAHLHQGAQPRGQGRRLRGDADRGQRRSHHRGLRPDHRRHGHVRGPLHAQRRGRPRRDPRGPRVGVPVRGPAARCSSRSRDRATAASTRLRRRPSSRPVARSRASSVSCPASWGCSRRPRRSRCCSTSAIR